MKKKIEKQQNINESLEMQVNELASLSSIQDIAKEYGLSYINDNIIVIKQEGNMNNAIRLNKFLCLGIVLLFGLIIGKLIYVSASTQIDGIDIKKFALSRTTEKKTLYANRGSIFIFNKNS